MHKRIKATAKGSGKTLRRRQTILAWGFALPFVVIFCVFMLIPLLTSMAMSFTDITSRDLRTPFNVNFVGLSQYITLFQDPRFIHSLGVTGIFVLVGLPFTMVIAGLRGRVEQWFKASQRFLSSFVLCACRRKRGRCLRGLAIHPAGRWPVEFVARSIRNQRSGLAA